ARLGRSASPRGRRLVYRVLHGPVLPVWRRIGSRPRRALSRLGGAAVIRGICGSWRQGARDGAVCQACGHLPNPTPADRVAVVAAAGLVPGHGGWRAVIVELARGEPVSDLDGAGAEGVHYVTASVSGRSPVRPCGWHCATPSTRSTISTTAMMIRPLKTMTRSLPVNRDSRPPRAAGSRVPTPARTGSKTGNLFLESVLVFEP